MTATAQHQYRVRPGGRPGCAVCGYLLSSETMHGHSCVGRIIADPLRPGRAYCYACGARYTVGAPVEPRAQR